MRIIFAGSPSIAVPCLETLCNLKDIQLVGVLTNPDTTKGRSGTLMPTDVGEAAQKLGVSTILKPVKLDAEAREEIEALKPDLLVSFAYGRIFGPKFLALFPLGGINIHPSLLPKYRGSSPIQAAILNRDTVTGISIQTLALEMDSGDILAVEQLQLTGEETASSLSQIVSRKASEMLPEVLMKIAAGTIEKKMQNNSEASFCTMFTKDDSFIDWKKSALEIDAAVRAFTPWPLCRTIHNGRELIILKASVFDGAQMQGDSLKAIQRDRLQPAPLIGEVLGTDKDYGILIQTGDGILAVTELQYQTKKALFWRDFLNGARDLPGSQLG